MLSPAEYEQNQGNAISIKIQNESI